MLFVGLSFLLLHVFVVFGTELTFELPDNDKQCFYEELEKDVKFDIDFQVISGGNYDVDCFVTDPLNNVLYNENKKQYDSFSHTTAMKGVYKVCFSNEFSTFTHKVVYLDFRHGDEDPYFQSMTSSSALTQVGLGVPGLQHDVQVPFANPLNSWFVAVTFLSGYEWMNK
ncbi:transmembrane emp24 domain-containing protein 3 [Xyrichtys novacula]|uniref:Transmembrane emp24 domain-containing protein 3 n=1 Tax=Xyrichtys novacula TaxID=13765 RepID=A0AAV1EJW1_XYRNO|nr:transmembrane emp24 domain-containing protein 3 [Xyrichtys novacula]